LGATGGATLRQVFQPSGWAIGLGILVAMLICHISRVNDGAKVAGYICGIVVVARGTHPWPYAVLRFTETVLGIGVAWLMSFVPKVIQIDETDSTGERVDTLVSAKEERSEINPELKGGAKTSKSSGDLDNDQTELT